MPLLTGAADTDFDWSNAKALWANAKPMDSENLMVTQAAAVKAANPKTRVFVCLLREHAVVSQIFSQNPSNDPVFFCQIGHCTWLKILQ